MANKDTRIEKEKPFSERFKRFLKSDKKNLKSLPEVKLSNDMIIQLGSQSAFHIRQKIMKEIEDSMNDKRLEDDGLKKIFGLTKDLLEIEKTREQKEAALTLFGAIISNTEKIGPNRVIFLTYLMESCKLEDPNLLFDFFRCLISDGRQVEYVEEFVGPLLIEWLPKLLSSYKVKRIVIEVVTNLLKFNAAHIDDYIVHELVLVITTQLLFSSDKEELYACLHFMDTIIAYVYVPNGTLSTFVSVLTRLVSIPFAVEESWKVMRNLLRTELGNTALCSLCEIIENSDDFHFVRGAIYFLTNALWTKSRLKSLTFTPMAILPTLHRASESLHPLVIYETAICLSKLVRNFPDELHLSSWDLLLDVLERLLYYTSNYKVKENAQMIFNVMNTTLDDIEEKIRANLFRGTLPKFYDLVDQYSDQRADSSVLQMLDYKIQKLNPKQPHWLNYLTSLTHKHFRKDFRAAIRLKTVSKLKYVFDKYLYTDSIAICKTVIITQLDEIELDQDIEVRKAAISLLVHIILSVEDPVIEKLLLFLEKIVLSPYAVRGLENVNHPKIYKKAEEAEDINEATKGLILIFKRKMWCLPSSHAIQAYQICMSSLECHYRFPCILEKLPHIRRLVFEMIFEMRADAKYHLGLPKCVDAQIAVDQEHFSDLTKLLPKYTPYIIVDHKFGQKPNTCFAIFNESSTGHGVELTDNGDDGNVHEDSTIVDKASDNLIDENFSERNHSIIEANTESSELNLTDCQELYSVENLNVYEAVDHPAIEDEEKDRVEVKPQCPMLESNEPSIIVTHLSLTKAARIVIVAMKNEKEWSLLKMILESVPQVLQNKALILSKDGNDIDYLATTLCALVTDKSLNLPNCLYNTPPKFCESDFQSYIFPVMAALASYHQHLDSVYQMTIIRCLQIGMLSKSGPLCVSAMTVCVLEMRTAMTKMLMDVMLTLSQISATVQNAQPTLEFLSTLLHLPTVYSDFSRKQTCTVFAISIPYTNPFKFNHYIVSLAYHVICMWFLKCRLPYRKYFVNYLAKNLNMILLNEEAPSKLKSVANEDQIVKNYDNMIQFHKDLRETCVDFMARNCFDTFSPVVKRSEVSQMLLKTGQQLSWLIGTRIVTVTTSGCSKRPIRQGLCDKCIQNCGIEIESVLEEPLLPQDGSVSRRRHKSDFHKSVSHEAKHLPQSKDDLHMRPSPKEEAEPEPELSGLKDEQKECLCACWCRGWAEIFIRQPTGNISYMVRSQNPRTQISKDERLPIHELSTFYSVGQEDIDGISLDKQDYSSSSERGYELYSPQLLEDIRPRAFSGGSEPTQASETVVGLIADWSNSGSVPSSGAGSLASSELKLDSKTENVEEEIIGHPVSHCYSNPEVHKGIILEISNSFKDKNHHHQLLSHSISLVEGTSKMTLDKCQEDIETGRNKLSCLVKQGTSSPSTPPLLPTDETSRIRHASAMQMKTLPSSEMHLEKDESDLADVNLQPIKRGRGHTISDMNPASRNMSFRSVFSRRPTIAHTGSLVLNTASTTSLPCDTSININKTETVSNIASSSSSNRSIKEITRGGVSPSSVFLQLYYQGCFGGSCFRPILLPPEHESSIKVLDLVNPHEHHKIGVIYVGPDQTEELEILGNTSGSERYYYFLEGLGSVHELKDLVADSINIGGLDKRGVDGNLVYMWQDDLMQVVFHVATAFPNKETDKNFNNKKRHIGNDCVTIVYNNSGKSYRYNTIKSQFNHFIVEIIPGDLSTNCVKVTVNPEKQELTDFVSWGKNDTPRLVSDISLPVLVRQLALHANLASTVWQSLKISSSTPYATTWLDRLRKIRKLREKIIGNEEADKHLQQMQELQFPPLDDPNEEQNLSFLDFSDMIEIDKSEPPERNRTACFLNRR